MRNMLHKLFLMTMISSLSVFAYAVPANNSILRLESKNMNKVPMYAVASKDDNTVSAKTETELTAYGLEYALWIAEVNGNTFKLKNLGTNKYLNAKEVNSVVALTLDNNSGLSLKEDNTGYYRSQGLFNLQKGYIQYDPRYEEWRIYADDRSATNKNNSQENGDYWSDGDYPQSNEETSMEIEGGDVEKLFMDSNGKLDIDAIKDVVANGNLDDVKNIYNAESKNIVVGTPATYLDAGSSFWKTAKIQLNVNSADWTPVSFPVDVKCVTSNLSGVGYQEYSTAKRANGEPAWVTNYVTSDKVFNRGVAYNFATENATMTLEFKPVSATGVTKVEKSYTQELKGTTGSIGTNQNWYYIGNALFVEAGLSAENLNYACVYNGGTYVELTAADLLSLDPFATFFVQYAGDYTMSSSAARSSAPMLAREKSATEKYYLRIEGEGEEDQTGIFFEEDASAEGYVMGEDFLSFATKGRSFTEIYTHEEDIEFSFNTRPMENTFVKVGLYVGKAGRYTISLDNISGNAESMVLYDNYEQDFARLHLGETYTFDSERGSFDDRFAVAVTYAPGTTTDNVSLEAVNLVVVGNEIQGVVDGADYAIYNSTGSLVYSDVAYAETVTLPNLNPGVYIVRTATGWTKFVVK